MRALPPAALLALAACSEKDPAAQPDPVARGAYLVAVGGCSHCHTPGYFQGRADLARFLGGSDVGFQVAGLGTFVGPNLTPDRATRLGTWTEEQIVTALQTGVRPDGRVLSDIMPWQAFSGLDKADARAIAAFLKSLPPVSHQVPGPFGPSEDMTVFSLRLVPPDSGTPSL